ncbi:hypothetical protein H6P81_003580 [Aristolochia fimbriata]|uniref:Cholesterol oxidase n=1 Tax=Aristolochia fimbriata TaxID=158543 RepID=A0AAV7FG87_ARIFI|nr:hypothetical protein H6P81_003580 [Aristolochia fimbriata]
MKDEESYDAVVIGSGYGGSVAACRLSMTGIKVCLIEKGRRWEAVDFPTNSIQMLSAVRMDMRNWGLDFGPKNALFQIHIQGDSLTGVVCGLGGGSLVNAGVMASTPARARKNLKWPKEWYNGWEAYEASALEMLRPHSVPLEFPSASVMRRIAEEIEDMRPNPIKLTMNIGGEGDRASAGAPQSLGSCLACGNCMSGCPYNAKNSTDKNYLARAVQTGCIVKTGRAVRFVVKNRDEDYVEPGRVDKRKKRRWRVYFDDFEFVSADFVVLSAGVLGTTEILFQSQRRGLKLSERLGFGLSCNGNNVAYVAASRAPLHAYGLSKKQLSQVPFEDRPGPAISSSYTSSLGFTIQNGVLPTSYPHLLFKGIFTYGWPSGYWFLHGLIDKLKHTMGLKDTQAMVLNMMGYDEADGRVTLDENTGKICFAPPRDPLLPRKIQVLQRLTRRLRGILFMSKFRSSSVHLLGSCNAASCPSNGVCTHDGQVFDGEGPPASVNQGLYVCDASLIPCSVGVNPCLTIAAAAEHVSRHLVQEVLRYKNSIAMQLPMSHQNSERAVEVGNTSPTSGLYEKPNSLTYAANTGTKMVTIRETLKGYVGGMPCAAYLTMRMNYKNKDHHEERDQTTESIKGEARGYVVLQGVEKDKLYIIDGKVDMCNSNRRTPYTQYMSYHFLLVSSSGSRYSLEGKKIMNPYLLGAYARKESTTLNIRLKKISSKDDNDIRPPPHQRETPTDLQGELYLSPFELLRSLITMTGTNKQVFIFALLRSLLRTYILQIPRSHHVEFDMKDMIDTAYPFSITHELKSGDGVTISCRQWSSNQSPWNFEGKPNPCPVLLINGHSTESFCLPTEPTDLVRTLIEAGYETWLLQPRLHPFHPSSNFTIEDIGKFDIPAVVGKIQELHGSSVKFHVVAHCVGGLAIHIALMGGHISSTQIASLSCTNSSMFFTLTTSALVKMRLPLIPLSTAILGKGKDTILTMLRNSEDSFGHRCIKQVARLIPRDERCTCDECEVFSVPPKPSELREMGWTNLLITLPSSFPLTVPSRNDSGLCSNWTQRRENSAVALNWGCSGFPTVRAMRKDSSSPNPLGRDNTSSFCIIEGPETVQDFMQMQLQEIQDNIRSRRNKIFLLMEEVRRLRVQQRIKSRDIGNEDGDTEDEMPDMPSSIPFLPHMNTKTLRQLYLTSFSIISGIIVFGGLITPVLELKLGLGGTSYEDFIKSMHLPLQLSQVDPIVASFSGGAVGVISALMLVEVNNVKQQEKKRCRYCCGTGYLPCARCSASGVCLSVEPLMIAGGSRHPLRTPTTKRCSNCSGAGKVMCPTCLCTGMVMASEHDPRINPFD